MPIESVAQRVNSMSDGAEKEQLRALLGNIVDGLQAIFAKMDADAGITDTNYAAVFATFIRD